MKKGVNRASTAQIVKPGYLGTVLREVLEDKTEAMRTSPTDFVMDLNHAAASLLAFLGRYEQSDDGRENHMAGVLLPLIRPLEEATRDKYEVTRRE